MTTRAELVAAAQGWLDTPYHHQGSVRGVGADCIGLIGGVAMECGVPEALAWYADSTCKGYGPQPDPIMLMAACERYLDEIPIAEARIADILVFKFEREPQHFGLITRTSPLTVIHSLAKVGCVTTHRVDSLWRSRVVRAYRFRGID